MLKLELQSFGHLMQRANSLDKTLMLGKIYASGTLEASGPLTTCWDGKGKGPRIAP